jgi:hypothetical protein
MFLLNFEYSNCIAICQRRDESSVKQSFRLDTQFYDDSGISAFIYWDVKKLFFFIVKICCGLLCNVFIYFINNRFIQFLIN